MPRYLVTLSDTHVWEFVIDADSQEEAEEEAEDRKQWDRADYTSYDLESQIYEEDDDVPGK